MKDEKKPLQLLQRTSETDDQLLGDSKQGIPVVFVDLETFTATGAIGVIAVEEPVLLQGAWRTRALRSRLLGRTAPGSPGPFQAL